MVPHPAMQDWRAIFGRNVRRLRQQRDMTQEEFAFEAEIDLTYMGGIERGGKNLTLSTLFNLADHLEITVYELLKGIA